MQCVGHMVQSFQSPHNTARMDIDVVTPRLAEIRRGSLARLDKRSFGASDVRQPRPSGHVYAACEIFSQIAAFEYVASY